MKRGWRELWWLDTTYWTIIVGMIVNIGGCCYCLLYPNSPLARGDSGTPAPPGTFVVSIVTGVGAICSSIWGLRLNARRRKLMNDYRRSLQ